LFKDKIDGEYVGAPPVLKLSYDYLHPFAKMTDAYLKRYNWEDRFQLTTIANVEQLDDDTLVYYRRHENLQLRTPAWERVTINRATNTMKAENIVRNPDGTEALIEAHNFTGNGAKT
jgi:hypothetical protein